jgi:hypothetical protein
MTCRSPLYRYIPSASTISTPFGVTEEVSYRDTERNWYAPFVPCYFSPDRELLRPTLGLYGTAQTCRVVRAREKFSSVTARFQQNSFLFTGLSNSVSVV